MAQFVQIGSRAYNIDKLEIVNLDCDGVVWLFFGQDGEDNAGVFLTGKRAEAFREWWNEHAQVYVCPLDDEPDEAQG